MFIMVKYRPKKIKDIGHVLISLIKKNFQSYFPFSKKELIIYPLFKERRREKEGLT